MSLLRLAGLASAQDYRKHNLRVTAGAGLPKADLRGLFADSFVAGVSYGYRFHQYFQVDAGFDTLFGAAGVRDFLPTAFGDLRIRDYQHMVPMGGTVILPLFSDRLQISGSGGAAYLRYSERIRQPFGDSGFRIDCAYCASRDGWGYYTGLGVSVAVDRAQNFRIGAGARVYRGETSGDAFGAVPARRTEDRWNQIFASFGFSF